MTEGLGPPRFLVAIAASAGGIPAIEKVLESLPADFPGAVLVVLHISPNYKSHLSELLSQHVKVHVLQARQGQALRAGVVYVAPPDHHLEVGEGNIIRLTKEPKVNFTRPSADPLFLSTAEHFGPNAVLVTLTGTGKNGSSSIVKAKLFGCLVIAQDQATSKFFGMPGAAIRTGFVDEILPIEEIGPRLVEYCAVKE